MAKYSNGLESKLDLSPTALVTLGKRYLIRDKDGAPAERPEDMFRRVSYHIACGEAFSQDNLKDKVSIGMPTRELYAAVGEDKKVMEFAREQYEVMTDFKLLYNSPTLMNAGRELNQLAACYVLPVPDDMSGIFDAIKNTALIHKSGGGTGFSFSRLRPRNSRVGSTGGVASGPVSFMKIFNAATEQIKQGGTRRGANMGILNVDHPDIMEFIYCKGGDGLNNFNISVGITADFIRAVSNKANYNLIDPHSREAVGELNATEVYDKLVHNAWKKGDPGIVFIDEMNRHNPTPDVGMIESTNPCGEQPLLPNEACNLASINLEKMVSEDGVLDKGELERVTRLAVRGLDNVIDVCSYPLSEIGEMVRSNRKIGLGVMGFAGLLSELGIGYEENAALEKAEEVMKIVNDVGHDESRRLGEERGSFPNYDRSIFKNTGMARRNATVTTIAPTGTLSIIANASSGIEPFYALAMKRDLGDSDIGVFFETPKAFEKYLKKNDMYDEKFVQAMAAGASVDDILMPSKIKEEIKRLFPTAHDISPEWQVRMQSSFQKYTDNAVSKTVNLPSDAGEEVVRQVYDLAYELGCKGVTVYRDGSKGGQVLNVVRGKDLEVKIGFDNLIEIPDIAPSIKILQNTPKGKLHLNMTLDPSTYMPIEVFPTIGSSGAQSQADLEALARSTSRSLRAGEKPEAIVNKLINIGSNDFVFSESGKVRSVPMALGMAMKKYLLAAKYYDPRDILAGKVNLDALASRLSRKIKSDNGDVSPNISSEENLVKRNVSDDGVVGGDCPECGKEIAYEEGCKTCHSCGYSACS